ncbi:MAG: NPCBM/NEW2 domain-containing protein [Sedimentisphaerales bacterium]|nr:NPCBM/NEW2 domain-containing protein [Sedimentisphaerales bacterium]
MEPKDTKYQEMRILICELVDGTITPDRIAKLNQILSHDPDAVSHYIDFLDIQVLIKSTMSNLENDLSNPLCSDEIQGLEDLWHQLAQEEKSAPEIEITQEKPQRELIQKVVYSHRERPKISRFNIVFLVMNAAAVLFFVLFIKFVPPKRGVDVAVLTDSFNAQWENVDDSMESGTRLAANSNELYLREGLAKLLFDNNAKVVIEGPARFKLIADDRIGLSYGRAYTVVPQEAVGFSVYTKNAKVIDLGTEFGVEVNSQGDTYLGVVKGQTQLIAGKKPDVPTMVVGQKTAKIVNGSTCEISSIPYNEHRFVRSFISANKAIWRGQSSLDLADIVRNGNGLGTGNSDIRLDPFKGFTYDQHVSGSDAVANKYLPIKDHPFIDGVFIPDGKTVVNSQGEVYEDFPATGGIYCIDLFANPTPGIIKVNAQSRTVYFNGHEYSDQGKPCILMHGNHGITFDLRAIRESYLHRIDYFKSRIGIADFQEGHPCNANIYVIVDGQVRYSLLQYKEKGKLTDISVELEDTDRFLTLVTADGEGPNKPDDDLSNRTFLYDWCVFAEPVLVLGE